MGFGKASRRRRQHQKDIPLIYARHIFCCLRRATFDWPKVAKGQSRRGISISPSLTIHPLKRPSIGERGPKWSPAKRVHLGEEEQGSGPIFRRQAEIEGRREGAPKPRSRLWGEEAQRSGRAFPKGDARDAQLVPTMRRRWPPYRVTPRGSPTVASVSTGGLRCHAAGAGGAGAPPRRGSPEGAISPEKPCFSYPVWIFLYQYYKME